MAAHTRRDALRLAIFGAAGALGLAACHDARAPDTSFTCTDETGLSDDDRKARATLAYLDRAPEPAKTCEKCQQFVPGASGCGTCKVLRGPVHPLGGCKAFAPRG